MIKNLETIKELLADGYDYIIIPKSAMDEPIELSTMIKEDEEGNEIGYASINELSDTLGSLFKPIEVSEFHKAYRWSYDIGLDGHIRFMNYMLSQGLVNMRDTLGNFDLTIENGIALCSIKAIRELPKKEQPEA